MPRARATGMKKRRLAPRPSGARSRTALVKLLRPIVRDLMAEELARLEDQGDAKASREAVAEGGAIPEEEFWKKYGL